MVKLLSGQQEVKFETTIFPDGTSQVWKIDDANLDTDDIARIVWLFESEAELFHVCQLSNLLQSAFDIIPDLVCPYLPYGRQDKDVDNKKSFALSTFKEILYNAGICRIEAFDAHSKTDMVYASDDMLATVQQFHDYLFNLKQHDVICYPDHGAAERYKYSFNIDLVRHITFDKVRDQLTGNITGLKLLGPSQLNGSKILIVDDICDGGMTFIKVAEELKKYNPARIDLAVSHGLFSKGKQVLHDAGVTNIYTTNSLLRNPEGFKVW